MEEYLKLLNSKQLEACIDTKGPSLIIAGAGSGKTRVLTSRIAYLIEHDKISPSNILAITFTNKAAREMQDRVDSLLGTKGNKVMCKTFHSFANYVLRREIMLLGSWTPSFQIIDDDETETLIKDTMNKLGYDVKLFKPSSMAEYISKIKSEICSFDSFDDYNREKIENTYIEYNKTLEANNLIDFDDLIRFTVEVFGNYPERLSKYQDQFKYILVDEFQDTSNIQYDLISLLGNKYKNVFIVGDEDQSIYSFRGANISNIKKFMKDFKDYHKHILDENYRSTQNILDCANNLIKHNKERIEKDLWTEGEKGDEVYTYRYLDDKAESLAVIRTIKTLVNESGYNYSDFAIIYRNNYLSRNFEDRLLYERIPYVVYSGLSFYKREEVKDLLAYLRLIINPNDFYSFKRCLLRPKRGVGDASISKIEENLNTFDGDIKEAIKNTKILDRQKDVLLIFMDVIDELRTKLNNCTIKEFFNDVYEKTGYKKMISEIDDEDKKVTKTDNIQELLNAIVSSLSLGSNEETIKDFLETVSLLSELDQKVDSSNHVSLITMHSAKGLEYRCVFAVGIEDDTIPGTRCFEPKEFEEERRTLYVCLTRAMQNLYISYSLQRFKYGNIVSTRPSRFISELGINEKGSERVSANKPTFNQPFVKPTSNANADFNVGDRVYHEIFKGGKISGIIDNYYIIRFDEYDTPKKIILGHPLLRKE